MTFSQALESLKSSTSVTRTAWDGKKILVMISSINIIFIKTAQNKYIQWVASQDDILADDWQEA